MSEPTRTITTIAATLAVVAVLTRGYLWTIEAFLIPGVILGTIIVGSWLRETLAGWPSYLIGCVVRSVPGYKRREARWQADHAEWSRQYLLGEREFPWDGD